LVLNHPCLIRTEQARNMTLAAKMAFSLPGYVQDPETAELLERHRVHMVELILLDKLWELNDQIDAIEEEPNPYVFSSYGYDEAAKIKKNNQKRRQTRFDAFVSRTNMKYIHGDPTRDLAHEIKDAIKDARASIRALKRPA